MQQLVKITFYVFLAILVTTSALILIGVAFLWFGKKPPEELPYLGWLLTIVIAEVVAVVIMVAKKGLKYLPSTETSREESETLEFMQRFISKGTSVAIVSNRASWLLRSEGLVTTIISKAQRGIRFEIITPRQVSDDIRNPLEQAGVAFFVTGETEAPESRFTLINADRSGAEKLAIARGVHPDHEITIFDANSDRR